MIYYFLVSAFFFGIIVGSTADKKPTVTERIVLFLLCVFWPFLAFIYAKDWLEGRK